MADDNGNPDGGIAAYLIEVWRTECRRHGDEDLSWPDDQAKDVAEALTGGFPSEEEQFAALERSARAFLGTGEREWSRWRLEVLDRVLRAGGSAYGLTAIEHLLTAEPEAPAPMAAPEPQAGPAEAPAEADEPTPAPAAAAEPAPPAAGPVAASAVAPAPVAEPITAVEHHIAPAARTVEPEAAPDAPGAPAPPVTGAEPPAAEPAPMPEPVPQAPAAEAPTAPAPVAPEAPPVAEPAVAAPAAPEPVAQVPAAEAPTAPAPVAAAPEPAVAAPAIAEAPTAVPPAAEVGEPQVGEPEASEPLAAAFGTTPQTAEPEPAAPVGAPAAPAPEVPASEPSVGVPAGEQAGEAPDAGASPFWSRVEEPAAPAGGDLRGMPEPPWPDEFETVPAPDAGHATGGLGQMSAAAGLASEGSVDAAPTEEELTEPTRSGVGVSVADRATFEATVCSLVDDRSEFTVAFVGLDEVSGPSLGVPDDAGASAAEEAACRALLWSLARKTADRGTCYAIGRGLVAVILDRGRPKDVDKLVRRLPAAEVSSSFSWGAARFPDEANDVRELLRMALVRLANMREEKLTPRILVNRLRRAVSSRN